MLRLEVRPAGSQYALVLFDHDGALVVEWVQGDADQPEVRRSPDGAVATVVAGNTITAVHLEDRDIVATCQAKRGIETALPLDGLWTLDVWGELAVDRGHTGFHGGATCFVRWPGEDPSEHRAQVARLRANLPVPHASGSIAASPFAVRAK